MAVLKPSLALGTYRIWNGQELQGCLCVVWQIDWQISSLRLGMGPADTAITPAHEVDKVDKIGKTPSIVPVLEFRAP
jgi:hypothetical protein